MTDPRVPGLLAVLEEHVPRDAAEAASCEELRTELGRLPTPFDETADPTHVTGSAIVTDGNGNVVLHRHKRLGIWLQPGGHVDGDESPWAAAQRETREETGLAARHPDDGVRLLHVDAHAGPRGHRHLDLRYLLLADPGEQPAPDDGESPEVAWFEVEKALGFADDSLASALRALEPGHWTA